jgi:hypothetical protein
MGNLPLPFGRRPALGSAALGDWLSLSDTVIRFYIVLTILAFLGVTTLAVTLATWLFVLPALVLMASTWLWLYLPIIHWPVVAWRTSGQLRWTLAALLAALVVPVGLPLIEDGLTELSVQRETANDQASAKLANPPESIALEGAGICDGLCENLLSSGAADHVLLDKGTADGLITQAMLVVPVRAEHCSALPGGTGRPLTGSPGWCAWSRFVKHPHYDAVIDEELGAFDQSLLFPFDPSSIAASRVDRIVVWSCPSECSLLVRRTKVSYVKLRWPLRVEYTSEYLTVHPSIAMVMAERGGIDPLAALKQSLGLDFSRGTPRPGFSEESGGMPGLEAKMQREHPNDYAIMRDSDARDALEKR